MKKFLITLIILNLIAIALLSYNNTKKAELGNALTFYPTNAIASTSIVSVTTTSKRLLATTTSGLNRIAAFIGNTNCSAGGTLYLNRNNDIAATVSTGPFVTASSSIKFNTYDNPVSNYAMQGIVNVGTCTVVITEWLR